MYLGLAREHRALRPRLDRDQSRARMNLRPGRHRRDEPQFVRAIVHHVAKAADRPLFGCLERRQQAEREKPMRDRPTKWTLFFGSLDVDMNPLMVAGHVGELIYFFLADVNRFAPRTEFFADLRRERRHIVKLYRLHRISSPGFRVTRTRRQSLDSSFIMQLKQLASAMPPSSNLSLWQRDSSSAEIA